MGKVTPENNASFVNLMIDRDLATMGKSDDKLDYLRDIGNHIDEVGETILRVQRDIDSKIGEDRPENDPSDIDSGELLAALKKQFPTSSIIDGNRLGDMDLLELLFELSRPGDEIGLNPPEFLRHNTCYKGDDATKWLLANKYPHKYDHIHVFEGNLCLLMPEDPQGDYAWIKPDGVQEEGHPSDVLMKMFQEYNTELNKECKQNG